MGFSDGIEQNKKGGSFRADVLAKKGKPYIYCVEMTLADTREDAYYFVAVAQDKRHLLEAEVKKAGQFHFEEYGQIVASGWGKPPQDVLDQLTEEYEIVWLDQ